MTFIPPDQITAEELREFIAQLNKTNGIVLQFHGKWTVQQNQHKVRPRVPLMVRELCSVHRRNRRAISSSKGRTYKR